MSDVQTSELSMGEGMSKKKLLLYAAGIGGGIGLLVFLLKGKGDSAPVQETDMLSTNAAIALGSLAQQVLEVKGAASIYNAESKQRDEFAQQSLFTINENLASGFHIMDTELDLIAGQLGYSGEWEALTPAQQANVLLKTEWYKQLDQFRHEYDAGGGSGLSYYPVLPASTTVQSAPMPPATTST